MKLSSVAKTLVVVLLATARLEGSQSAPSAPPAGSWPSFRGPHASGVADTGALPSEWDIATGRHVRWVTSLPGYAHSSPVVWGESVFVLTSVSGEPEGDGRQPDAGNVAIDDLAPREWKILSLDRRDGSIRWERAAHSGVPRVKRHEKGSHANATPATDGRYLVAVFNSEGLFCYDLDGLLLWTKDLGRLDPGYWGRPERPWGHASSPVIVEDRVIVQADKFEDSFIAAYDLGSGEQVWRKDRVELATWSTPTLYRRGGRTELITQGGNYARGYDPATGEELWQFADHAEVKVPTPFVAGDVIILTGGAPRGRPIYALKTGATGDISTVEEARRWTITAGGPYTSTPIAYRSYLFVTRDAGMLAAYALASGELLHRKRLGSGFSASPVAGDGKLFLTSEDGEVFVVRPDPELEVMAQNDMDEPCFATPALSGDLLLIRTRSRLYGIGR